MPYLINPFGRIVAVDNPDDYEAWLAKPGFQKATPEQEREHIKQKLTEFNRMNAKADQLTGVYLATVSRGGKDGYSNSSDLIERELLKLDVNIKRTNLGQKIAILFHNPYSIVRLENDYRLIYTMFESDKIPDDWIDYLESADRVLVPSKWCQSVFKKAGIDTEVVNLGYDNQLYTYIDRPIREKKRQNFTFLHYNAFNIRKGFPEVLKAFVKEFDPTEPVRMIFKTTLTYEPLPITKAQYPNIEVLLDKVSNKEMHDILARSDCFVFPSRGEGFGLTPLEAMATGLPTIVPNAHGISEYFNKDYMYEVKVKEECPALYSRYKNQDVGKMVICDVDDLRKQMRWIYEHQQEAHTMGRRASEYVKEWTIEKTAKKLTSIIDEILLHPPKKRALRNILILEKVK